MRNQLLHTPDGVRDIYKDECERKLVLEGKLQRMMKGYGYHPIQTPTFEFFDIFSKEIGTTPSRELYKFFDRDGNTLVLRPDFTPSIARCASKYFMDQKVPLRFCYNGNRFINNSSYQGRLKESTQSGAELIGDGSVAADAEILALVIQLLLESGLKEFQVSVGHTDYLKGLFEAANLGEDREQEIIRLLLNRNFYGVEEEIAECGLNEDLTYLFGLFKDVMMTQEKIRCAKVHAEKYPTIYGALERLEQLEDLLRIYKVQQYVYYEPALVSKYNYYTGIIFAGYTFGSGEAVVTGGRYDNLPGYFGKNAPAIGFAIIIDQLMSALHHQNIDVPIASTTCWFLYQPEKIAEVITDAQKLRAEGLSVELLPLGAEMTKEAYLKLADSMGVTKIEIYE